MTKITTAVLDQKLEDMKDIMLEVKQHAQDTNGKIAEAILEINRVKTIQGECPARKEKEKGVNRQWVQWGVQVVFTLSTIFLTVLGMTILR